MGADGTEMEAAFKIVSLGMEWYMAFSLYHLWRQVQHDQTKRMLIVHLDISLTTSLSPSYIDPHVQACVSSLGTRLTCHPPPTPPCQLAFWETSFTLLCFLTRDFHSPRSDILTLQS